VGKVYIVLGKTRPAQARPFKANLERRERSDSRISTDGAVRVTQVKFRREGTGVSALDPDRKRMSLRDV